MTGHALPWVKDTTDADRAAAKQQAEINQFNKKAADVEAQQNAQKLDLQKKINQNAIAFLRARFSVAGGQSAKNPTDNVNSTDTAATLFTRLTGQ